MTDVPLCKNCRHFRPHSYYASDCARPVGSGFSLVTGDFVKRLDYPAQSERESPPWYSFHKDRCGPAGRYFEEGTPR